jgi:uncharacterized protein
LKTSSFIFFLFISVAAFSQHTSVDTLPNIPPARGRVNDFVELFTKDEVKSLDSLIETIQKNTTIQVALATIDSTMLGNLTIEDYALNMLRTWGVGEKGKNNGILIVIAPDIHRMRVENGYGIEKYISNEETKEIIDTVFIPHFKEDNFFLGTRDGILSLIKKLKQKGYH